MGQVQAGIQNGGERMNKICIEETKTIIDVEVEGGVSLTKQQENYIKPHTWYDQLNGAYWVSIKTLKECIFLCPNESIYPGQHNLKQLIEKVEAQK
jgi:hypothetical protein